MTLRFTAQIKIHGVNPYVLVSAKLASQLKSGWRKPMPVLVQINGKPDNPWPINMMPVGEGRFRLYLHAKVRSASQSGVGQRVAVSICFNNEYKAGPGRVPLWFRAAVDRSPAAQKNWAALIPSRKKEIIRYLAALRSQEARERNLARAVEVLSGAPKRFMARSWNAGR